MFNLDLLQKLAQAVSFAYKGGMAPNIMISWLPNKQWYVTINRYNGSIDDKQILFKIVGPDLEECLLRISNDFLAVETSSDPISLLKNSL